MINLEVGRYLYLVQVSKSLEKEVLFLVSEVQVSNETSRHFSVRNSQDVVEVHSRTRLNVDFRSAEHFLGRSFFVESYGEVESLIERAFPLIMNQLEVDIRDLRQNILDWEELSNPKNFFNREPSRIPASFNSMNQLIEERNENTESDLFFEVGFEIKEDGLLYPFSAATYSRIIEDPEVIEFIDSNFSIEGESIQGYSVLERHESIYFNSKSNSIDYVYVNEQFIHSRMDYLTGQFYVSKFIPYSKDCKLQDLEQICLSLRGIYYEKLLSLISEKQNLLTMFEQNSENIFRFVEQDFFSLD